jgi:hypothetical protein
VYSNLHRACPLTLKHAQVFPIKTTGKINDFTQSFCHSPIAISLLPFPAKIFKEVVHTSVSTCLPPIHLFFYLFTLVVLGFEFRALRLLDGCSST